MMMPIRGRALVGVSEEAKGVSRLSNDVGEQLVFQARNLIFQQQLALFKALKLKLIERRLLGQARDHIVKIAVFLSQARQLLFDHPLFVHRTRIPICHPLTSLPECHFTVSGQA